MNTHGAFEFLQDYPDMSFGPVEEKGFTLFGTFRFIAHFQGLPSIEDEFELEILVPDGFPYELPMVTELAGKIPRNNKFHINPDDTLCVGSPLRISFELSNNPTLRNYANKFLVPYLYAVSHKLKFGGGFVFGELEHGLKGVLWDYKDLLGLDDIRKVGPALKLLSMKKRLANKKICPCGCNQRLGKCNFRFIIADLRESVPRSYYIKHLTELVNGRRS
ncbi:hypothetical protein GLW07_12590 [Bacillus hwajinpoensis]|uniref:SEC-C domain-containing protein n=1 Tax=Guptibacillus hwajinpoensis TaxID=208199 RepID=A0A845F083_9BACL|nr:hypothetical protein [Pseudalkalibacillus hwajinpoensis]MYL64189.1 hypothetical protein [Pseudalkalibacillus hwajinpoensis]